MYMWWCMCACARREKLRRYVYTYNHEWTLDSMETMYMYIGMRANCCEGKSICVHLAERAAIYNRYIWRI